MRVVAVLALIVLAAGCAQAPLPGDALGTSDESASFRVPGLRLGDELTYNFTFETGDRHFQGVTVLKVLERGPATDGLGQRRDAIHVRQGAPGGGFGEDYWIDARTFEQFHLRRPTNYSEASHFPISPLAPVPLRRDSYGNGTGTLDRFLEDPVFEDFSFFGGFLVDREVPAEGDLEINGTLWQREGTTPLGEGPWTCKVAAGPDDRDSAWGATRGLQCEAQADWGERFRETIAWKGSFASNVPLVIDADRTIQATFGDETFDVRFGVVLSSYTPGTGEPLLRAEGAPPPARRAAEFTAFQSTPPEGTGAKLAFPFAEAWTALQSDTTAQDYFQKHSGSYLDYAHLEELDTSGFWGPVPPAASHWWRWFGVVSAPDDWQLWFQVDKYADASGNGPVVVTPVDRDYPFDVIFGAPAGETPTVPPDPAVSQRKVDWDIPPRSDLGPDSLTFGSALQVWKDTAEGTAGVNPPNFAAVWLLADGYSYYVGREDWVFPPEAPLVFLYDDGPLVLERHSVEIDSTGRLLMSLNFETKVEQK